MFLICFLFINRIIHKKEKNMSLAILNDDSIITQNKITSFNEALAFRNENVWQQMNEINVKYALESWLSTLSNLTKKNYRSAFNMLIDLKIINANWSLQTFSLINHIETINSIKQLKNNSKGLKISECTLQARAAAYISFTSYLSDKLDCNFKRAVACKFGVSKTFKKVRELVDTEAMTESQWKAFFFELEEINYRDCLIAKLAIQGAKRISEVLLLTVNMIDFQKNEITFIQSKTKGTYKETVITYPNSIMCELKNYIADREDLAFITRTNSQVLRTQVQNTFAKAGVKANIPFKVTPHVLRVSAITHFKKMNLSDSDIMKVSGHSSSEMIRSYDKSARADNASKKVNLIN